MRSASRRGKGPLTLPQFEKPCRQVAARCCELPKDVRRRVVKELVAAGCLAPCFDHRGIPAYRATAPDDVEAGLEAIKAAKVREAGS